ncbi:unnamed protein product [Rotaria sp. Silwood2]|nr:unnamed protein product [Rotaria sp. Silwood2]CAF3209296.1 unnamed protein product [Rotaria sp. Silwood2]CAF3404975.1 unnamed protein product [Rotaria sp. Silwood2]CAF4055944.1 unnamed protein product [Rotaria sp. Silwood2]CAF4154593.1 unnamed protein product [Rotaria sp. Silwood2]
MPPPKTEDGITSDEEDLPYEDTSGSSNVPEQSGKEAKDRRNSDGSGKRLIKTALLPYVFYKLFSKNIPFPMAQ